MSGGLHALFLGIEHYLPTSSPGMPSFPSLKGSVRDVTRMRELLESEAGLRPECTLMLTARATAEGQIAEPPDRRPTYANIVEAFRELARRVMPGDLVYIQYSGHGARMDTIFPALKGEKGKDESLVPCDISDPGVRYLRDVELVDLLQLLFDRQALVTVVLDCCHSGGAVRKLAVPRGLLFEDRTPRPADSLVAPREQLEASWRRWTGRVVRGLEPIGLPVPEGCVLFAGCRPSELAFEYPFESWEYHGALTYRLLGALRRHGLQASCKKLHDIAHAHVHGQFLHQTPMLLGDASRPFLGRGSARSKSSARFAVTVVRIEGRRVLLGTGVSQGVQVGARFLLDLPGEPQKVIVEICQAGSTESWAEAIEGTSWAALEPGAQVHQVRAGPAPRRTVSLVGQALPEEIDQEEALDQVRRVLEAGRSGFVRLAAAGEAVDFHVAVNEKGEYEILDHEGAALRGIPSQLSIRSFGAVPRLLQYLDHLAKFRNVQQLENQNPDPDLAGKLEVELLDGGTAQSHGRRAELRPGEVVALRMTNRSSRILNLAVLDLRPDWEIVQVFPQRYDFDFCPIDPGDAKELRFRGRLPRGWSEGTDLLKVFAILRTASFRWLELPPLGQAPGVRRGGLTPSGFPDEEWIACEAAVRIAGP